MNINSLPTEILLNILGNLRPRELITFCSVCKYSSHISKDWLLCKNLIHSVFGIGDKIYPDMSWYENYVHVCKLIGLFNPQQLQILRQFKEISPQNFNILRTLYRQPYYYCGENQQKCFKNLVISVVHNGEINKSNIYIPQAEAEHNISIPLIIENGLLKEIFMICVFSGELLNNLYKFGYHTRVSPFGYCALLTMQHLYALQYVSDYI